MLRLQDWNPSIKGLAVIMAVILLSLTLDPITPLLALIWTTGMTFVLGRVSWKKWLLGFAPFLIMCAGYVWTAILLPRAGADGSSDVVWEWGSFSVTAAVLHQALSLGLQVLIFSALSLLFILTTDPVRFMLSLMQQCRLSPQWAYGILAGYRFLLLPGGADSAACAPHARHRTGARLAGPAARHEAVCHPAARLRHPQVGARRRRHAVQRLHRQAGAPLLCATSGVVEGLAAPAAAHWRHLRMLSAVLAHGLSPAVPGEL